MASPSFWQGMYTSLNKAEKNMIVNTLTLSKNENGWSVSLGLYQPSQTRMYGPRDGRTVTFLKDYVFTDLICAMDFIEEVAPEMKTQWEPFPEEDEKEDDDAAI